MPKTNEKMIMQAAISKLEELSLYLDTELEVTANMSIQEVEDNLRLMDLDPNHPLPPKISRLVSEKMYGQGFIDAINGEMKSLSPTVFVSGPHFDDEFRDKVIESLMHGFGESLYSKEEVCERAFSLAAYSIGNFDSAEKIAVEVADSLDILCESELFSYDAHKPSLQHKPNTAMNLDQLIFDKILHYKKRLELESITGASQLNEDAVTLWFMESLIGYSLNHDSSYLAIGIGNLLFNYDLHSVQKIYEALNPQSSLAPDMYRRRKKRIIDYLERSYSRFLNLGKTNKKEYIFRKNNDPSLNFRLVKDWLDKFKPLAIDCTLPHADSNLTDYFAKLSYFLVNQTADEHLAERCRMHLLVHPPCFFNLIKWLDIPLPEQHLALQTFSKPNTSEREGVNLFEVDSQLSLDQERKERIEIELIQRRKRRENMRLDAVTVTVDGVEHGTVNLDKRPAIHLTLKEGSSVIEFRGHDEKGSVPIGTHVLHWDKSSLSNESYIYYIVLKGKQILHHTIKYITDTKGNLNGAIIKDALDIAGY